MTVEGVNKIDTAINNQQQTYYSTEDRLMQLCRAFLSLFLIDSENL